MAYTNTTLLGLNQPTTGQESGVWGDDVNNGFTQLVDLSVAGTNNITQDSDITLAISNGNNSSSFTSTATNSTVAQYAILNCTGARTAARNIIVPATSKTYVITNNTTGGYAITIKKTAGTGVSIANGETAIVFYNTVSGDVAKVSSLTTFGAITATSITNTGLTSGRVVYSTTGGLETDSANFTFNGTTATINTLNLTNALGTTNGGTGLTSFTANGVVYASSTSALATGSALQFDGTNLGLGVTPPAWGSPLSGYTTTYGAYGAIGQSSNGSIQLIENAYYNGTNWIYRNTADNALRYVLGAGNHTWYNAPTGTAGNTVSFTQAMTLNNSGQLLVGTTSSPSNGSTVGVFSGTSNVGIQLNTSTSGGVFISNNNGAGTRFYNYTGAVGSESYTEVVRIDSAGNLGLGVTPSAWFSTYKAIQFNTNGAIWANSDFAAFGTNNYTDASGNDKYLTTNYATRYRGVASSGQHQWFVAPSGTSGTNISFTQAMTLTNAGNLGIGTSSPSASDFNASAVVVQVNQNTTNGGLFKASSSNTNLIMSAGNALAYVWTTTASPLTFGTNTTENMRLDTSGNLGLGVTPSAWDTVKPLQMANGSIYGFSTTEMGVSQNMYYGSGQYRYIATAVASTYRQISGVHSWHNAPSGTAGNAISFTQAMTLDNSGNLYLGATSGGARFYAYAADGGNVFGVGGTTKGVRISTNSTNTQITGVDTTLSGSYQPLAIGGSYVTLNYNGNNEAARIDSSGNLLVGTTSTLNSSKIGYQFDGNAGYRGLFSNNSTGGAATHMGFYTSGTSYGSISSSTTGTGFNTTSDYRLKNTIAPMTGALAKVAQLKPVTYKWNVDGSDSEGFIAHELAEVCPHAVTGEKDAVDKEGKPVYQGIDTSFLVATLTAAIQELSAKVTALEAKLGV